ncbi:MAG: hypothetical protein ACR2FO_03380 [Actinomycetota bacterium]
MNKRSKAVVATLALAILAGSAAAWACTPQYTIFPLSLQAGAPGSQVVVTGQADAKRAVEVRWDSAEGPVLGSASAAGEDQEFRYSVPVTIPEASPGVHYLMVLAKRDPGVHPWEVDAQGRWVARAAFNVLTSAPSGQSTAGSQGPITADYPDLWRGFQGGAQLGNSGITDAGRSAGGNGQAALGMAFLVLGFVGVSSVAGLGLAGRSRRRRASNAGE